jgi:hypothetical protein
MTMNLRRAKDGELRITGAPPERHVFSSYFIERELTTGGVDVLVMLAGETYRLVNFTDESGTPNATAWSCERVTLAHDDKES